MTNYVLLDNNTHKNLKVISGHSPDLGDNVGYTIIFPSELRQAQSHYPIIFKKNAETNNFEIIVLFGFHEQENLFLENNKWSAGYIPLSIKRKPFLIGFRNNNQNDPVIYVDDQSPRISYQEGESVFLEYGGNSEYLKQVNGILGEVLDGYEISKAFVQSLIEYELIEPFTLKTELNDATKIEISVFHTLNEEKLAKLDSVALGKLHSKGYLELIYMIIASLSNFRILIDKKNSRI